jgi:hypothetical protein
MKTSPSVMEKRVEKRWCCAMDWRGFLGGSALHRGMGASGISQSIFHCGRDLQAAV